MSMSMRMILFIYFASSFIAISVALTMDEFNGWQCPRICDDFKVARRACKELAGNKDRANVCETYNMAVSDAENGYVSARVAVCKLGSGAIKCLTLGDGNNSLLIWNYDASNDVCEPDGGFIKNFDF